YYSFSTFNFYLMAKKQFRREFLYNLIGYAFMAVVSILAAYLWSGSFLIFIIFFFLSHILPSMYFYLACTREKSKGENDPQLMSYGWLLTKVQGIIEVANNIDSFIIGLVLGPATLAIYAIGVMVPQKMRLVINAIFLIFFPKFSTKEVALTKRKLLVVFAGSILLFIVVVLLLPLFIKLLFWQYTEAITYGIIYALTLLFLPLNTILGIYFKGTKNTNAIQKPILLSRAATIILAYPVLQVFHIYGLIGLKIFEQALNLAGNLFYFVSDSKY
ncbi:oligosaccharide flippase family protein, partial [Candidatus Altiarchaeota archaeon]